MSDSPSATPRRAPPFHVLARPHGVEPAHLAAADLGARLSVLSAAARRVRRSQDSEAVHDLRVASRRLTAAIDLWRPLLEPKGARRARRRARRLRRDLATLRDLEVSDALLAERMIGATPAVRAALEPLLRDGEQRLERERADAAHVASRRRVRRVRDALERALGRAPSPAAPLDPRELADDHVRATRERATLALETAWMSGEDRALHAARIRVKRWRYAIECRAALIPAHERAEPPAEPTPSPNDPQVVKRLRQLQDLLGRIQDLAVLRERLESAARRAALHARPAEAAALQSVVVKLAPTRALAAAEAQRLSTTLSAGAEGRAGV
ncbi:MAG TPA: CHAD domain-containing protein [Candidatus Sulfotelmatobacter sp.]|nr:CHAD domain-containing protein [Candidatus Sulfotelmatobacter sp.]